MYGSRGLGLLLTLAIIARLGISDYGLYALAFSFATILGPPLDNPWAVRAIRESDEDFNRERSSRYLVGVALVVAGLALLPFEHLYLLWFGLVMAGSEMAFNSLKSRAARDGHPNLVWRYDAIRQTSSVALVCAYLFAVDDPTLKVTSLLYCTPYAVILVMAGVVARGHRPGLPGSLRQMTYLSAEMGLGTAAYLQGDVLLLGFLTDSTVVGYYNITLMVATALAGIGQSFAMTYHEPLRKSGGDLKTGPKLRLTLTIASAVGAIVLVTGVIMLFTPAPAPMAESMVIMAGFCFLRTVICVFQVILYAQRRDRFRLASSIALLPVKFALLTVLVKLGLGAVAAATATTASDGILLAIFATALYRKGRR
jgi:O-antigen/teichoic acid export membrane protein